LQVFLKYAGAAYLVYLAVVIAISGPPKPGETGHGPMTFWQGAMFQWVNVKGWVAVIGTITAYAGIANFPFNIILQVLIFFVMGVASITTWTLFGSALRPWLTSERAVRGFNIAMAILLLASLYPVVMDA
jgi:threonine/homoserine/homoserine lactone efflux protein